MYSYLCKLFEPDPAKFNVLNHGDLWVNNLQFSDTEVLLVGTCFPVDVSQVNEMNVFF